MEAGAKDTKRVAQKGGEEGAIGGHGDKAETRAMQKISRICLHYVTSQLRIARLPIVPSLVTQE